jgi:hypothetical protein
MNPLKNIAVGFLVSFIGSIPLGYLNIIGFEIYAKVHLKDLIGYLLGVVIVEAIVIYCTLVFANRLVNYIKLIKFIEFFSILFMFFLAASFYLQSDNTMSGESGLTKYIKYSPFVIGIIFSSLNFIQIPFWTAWNLYLVNGNYISVQKSIRLWYVLGTLVGTFFGMMALILFLSAIDKELNNVSGYVISYIIPIFFLGMGLYQTYKFYKKYYFKSEKQI